MSLRSLDNQTQKNNKIAETKGVDARDYNSPVIFTEQRMAPLAPLSLKTGC